MATTTPASSGAPLVAPDVMPRQTPAVTIWAVAGALILAFIIFVLVRWVTGPLFERVPSGPSEPPAWMKVNLIFWQVVSIPIALGVFYRFVIRPWRRERHIGVDGLLVLAFSSLWFQDPLASIGGVWFTYNSWLVNWGSWLNSVPGALAPAEPGAMLVEPPLIIPALYVYFFLIGAAVGCWAMRMWRRRRPTAGAPELIGVCFLVLIVFDLVFEGLIWMPGGIWEYPGGHVPLLFPERYHKFPLQEMLTAGATLTAVSAVRFFLNDKGQSIAERGSEHLRGGPVRKTALRALAMTAVVHICFLVCYTLPNGFLGLNSTEWPKDLQKRSYFTDYICGQGTDRACPGPSVPIPRNDNGNPDGGSAQLGTNGKLVVPPDTTLPKVVPFDE